jgi:hypothetical protein
MSAILSLVAVFVINVAGQTDAGDPATNFYRLTDAAPAAFAAGEDERAQALAVELLSEAERWRENWNYGNAVHAANLVLGRLSLIRGEINDAKKFLLAAGRTPGSPQRNTFGPDMLFAKEMLKKGETETVLKYFELCSTFWGKKHSRLDSWKLAIEKNEDPDFGPNLRYFFPQDPVTAR